MVVAVALVMIPFLGGFLEWGPPMSIGLVFGAIVSTMVAFFIILCVSLPGFVAFRLGLHWLRRSDLLSFLLAGVVNAWLVLIVLSSAKLSLVSIINSLQRPMDFVVIFGGGGLAGLTSWAVERSVARQMDVNLLKAEDL